MLQNKFRFVYMILTGIALSVIFRLVIFRGLSEHPYLIDVITTCIITITIWEGNLRLDHWLNKKYPWQQHAQKRVLIQLVTAFLFTGSILFVVLEMYHQILCPENDVLNRLKNGTMIMSLFVSFMLLAIEIGLQFFRHWKSSLLEVEKYKTESAQAQLQNLKSQINPHFLFNNLSVLNSLVHSNPERASDFIQELSRVYRYVLEKRNTELVTLQEELEFIQHYVYLLRIRFDENLVIHETIKETVIPLWLPPMCLQPLLENCIQHNEVSKARPLHIHLFTEGDYFVVQNTLQPRLHDEPSTNSGLRNIQDRYRYFTSENVVVSTNNNTFTVKLPLLQNV